MAFGIDTGISRASNHTVQAADMIGPTGEILESTTHGGAKEVQEEGYLVGSFVNEALNGQVGDDTHGVVTAHNLTEANADYAKVSRTTRFALAAPSLPLPTL